MSNFAPLPRSPLADPYGDNESRMHGAKANYSMALLTSETCLGKCHVGEASARMSEGETECMRQCFVKYFDAQLLIQNEMTNYVRGIDL